MTDSYPENFVCIAGAPRCGTSALASYLAEHPDIGFSKVKEPHFFTLNQDLTDRELRFLVENEYIPRYFGHLTGEQRFWAEGSVSFFYQPKAALKLLTVWPNAKFIIALRDPIDMLPSLHERSLYQGDENIRDFARAWRLTAERKQGRFVPWGAVDPRLLHYDEVGRLGHYLEQFLRMVGRERCHVVVYDDFAQDPGAVYRGILEFLALPDDGRADFQRKRHGKSFRLGWLQRALKRPPQKIRSVLAGPGFRVREKQLKADSSMKAWLIARMMKGRQALLSWNSMPSRRQPLAPDVRREIHELLRDDTSRLGKLLNRDLSHWLAFEAD